MPVRAVTGRRYLESVARLADIVFDCERPAFLARWWASTHLDLRSDDLEAEVARLVHRGAVVLYRIGTNVTMADPEGNEFCINPNAV